MRKQAQWKKVITDQYDFSDISGLPLQTFENHVEQQGASYMAALKLRMALAIGAIGDFMFAQSASPDFLLKNKV